MKKRFLSILLSLCIVLMLFPVTAFAEESGRIDITINGPDEICAQQDYEFTVTASEGVTIVNSIYGNDYVGNNVELTPNGDGVLSGVVHASCYSTLEGSFILSVSGTMEGQTQGISASKTVTIQPHHIFVDGVCGCGAVQQYTVTYDGGADYGLMAAIKTHGEDLTLLGETFHRKGYVQTGWMDKSDVYYELSDVYTTDADMTFYPVWDEIATLTVPFTTTVKLGGNTAPGETTFDLAIVGANSGEKGYADVTVSGSVTTDGAGDYEGTLTLTGPSQQLWYMLCEGAFVQQVNAGEEGWTYDDTVWGLLLSQIAAYSTADSADYTVLVLPTVCEETDDGVLYDIDWEAIDWDAVQSEEMRFENVYTAHEYEQKHDETSADVPQTGDNSNPALWYALLAVSAASVISTDVYSKRRRNSRTK